MRVCVCVCVCVCACVCVCREVSKMNEGIWPSYQKFTPFNNFGFCFVHLLKLYQKHAINGHDAHV